ncbi:MAG: hypothetical protein CVU11_15810 [Bacteroidetes bacterium HGW-Bacteroidetes-6]|nr:MAG: hypothetical protein CVU11_15810 [Bacteroidetes bacterium HGW-Bacteroidetes-6]
MLVVLKLATIWRYKTLGLLPSQITQKLERATMLEYPLKPLWHINFVSISVVFIILFLFSFQI